MKSLRKLASFIIFVGLFIILSGKSTGLTQTEPWSEAINISNTATGSWFPELVIDSKGNIHVIWCETEVREDGLGMNESIYYATWNGSQWSEPNDLVSPNVAIARNALTIDKYDNLSMVYRQDYGFYLQQAPADKAWSAAAWTPRRRVDANGTVYISDLAVDSKGVMHLAFDDRGSTTATICIGGCSDIFYRQSTDQGQTWSYPTNLSQTPVGASRVQIEIDSRDTIHIAWDEGWDRLSGAGEPNAGYYTFSADGGTTWAPTTVITYPQVTVAQLTVGSNGAGGVMLVWRATTDNELYYQQTSDNGLSWSTPMTITGIAARPWSTPFDMYDMTTDSAGNIHLLVTGQLPQTESEDLGIYHLVWDGQTWSIPTEIFKYPELYPEYPKILVHEGNRLHAVWFTREGNIWSPDAQREIWYSHSIAAAPYLPQTSIPTPTPLPSTPTPIPTPTIMPTPTIVITSVGLPEDLYTDHDDVLRLAAALSPLLLLILIVIAVRMGGIARILGMKE